MGRRYKMGRRRRRRKRYRMGRRKKGDEEEEEEINKRQRKEEKEVTIIRQPRDAALHLSLSLDDNYNNTFIVESVYIMG